MTYVRPPYLGRMVIGRCLRSRHRLPIEHREEHQGAIETHVAETVGGQTYWSELSTLMDGEAIANQQDSNQNLLPHYNEFIT